MIFNKKKCSQDLNEIEVLNMQTMYFTQKKRRNKNLKQNFKK